MSTAPATTPDGGFAHPPDGAAAGRPDGVFISYRRSDAQHAAGRLADALEQALGDARVFRDLHDIGAGQDFAAALTDALSRCGTVLVVIGPGWLSPGPAGGPPRLHDPQDWVRREIASGLARGLRVVPVLLELTPLPQAADLPDELAGLVRRQALRLQDSDWARGVQDLLALLQPAGGSGPGAAGSRTGAASVAAAGAAVSVAAAAPPASWLGRLAGWALRWLRRILLTIGALIVASVVLAVACTADTPDLSGPWQAGDTWRLAFRSLGPSSVATQAQYEVTGSHQGRSGRHEIRCHADQQIEAVTLACQATGVDGRQESLRCAPLRFVARPAGLKGDCVWQADGTVSRVVLQRP